jgi:hypothetical protein
MQILKLIGIITALFLATGNVWAGAELGNSRTLSSPSVNLTPVKWSRLFPGLMPLDRGLWLPATSWHPERPP